MEDCETMKKKMHSLSGSTHESRKSNENILTKTGS